MTSLGFLLGRTCCREGQLLSAAEWNKDFAAETFEQLEDKLNQDFAELRRDLFKDTALTDIFWSRYDNHNLKILLKEKLTEQNFDHYLLPYAKDVLTDFDPELVRRALEVYEKTKDFCRMDYFLDTEYFRGLQELAKKYDKYVRAHVRALAAAAEYKYAYGSETAPQKLRAEFPGLELPENADEGAVEKALEDFANRQLFAGRYGGGITRVLCFLQAKENEMKNLKTMYLSRKRELKNLRNYLRYSYV